MPQILSPKLTKITDKTAQNHRLLTQCNTNNKDIPTVHELEIK